MRQVFAATALAVALSLAAGGALPQPMTVSTAAIQMRQSRHDHCGSTGSISSGRLQKRRWTSKYMHVWHASTTSSSRGAYG